MKNKEKGIWDIIGEILLIYLFIDAISSIFDVFSSDD